MLNLKQFKKLDFSVFSKKELNNNQLRSINGGWLHTCEDDGNGGDRSDVLHDDGSTWYDGGDCKCDTNC